LLHFFMPLLLPRQPHRASLAEIFMEADILPVEAIVDPRTFADSAVLRGLLTRIRAAEPLLFGEADCCMARRRGVRIIAAVRAGQSDAIRCSVPTFQADIRSVPRGAPGTYE
jgi:hypothetical protein